MCLSYHCDYRVFIYISSALSEIDTVRSIDISGSASASYSCYGASNIDCHCEKSGYAFSHSIYGGYGKNSNNSKNGENGDNGSDGCCCANYGSSTGCADSHRAAFCCSNCNANACANAQTDGDPQTNANAQTDGDS